MWGFIWGLRVEPWASGFRTVGVCRVLGLVFLPGFGGCL